MNSEAINNVAGKSCRPVMKLLMHSLITTYVGLHVHEIMRHTQVSGLGERGDSVMLVLVSKRESK